MQSLLGPEVPGLLTSHFGVAAYGPQLLYLRAMSYELTLRGSRSR